MPSAAVEVLRCPVESKSVECVVQRGVDAARVGLLMNAGWRNASATMDARTLQTKALLSFRFAIVARYTNVKAKIVQEKTK